MEASSGVAASLNQCNVFFLHIPKYVAQTLKKVGNLFFVSSAVIKLEQLIIMKSIQGRILKFYYLTKMGVKGVKV